MKNLFILINGNSNQTSLAPLPCHWYLLNMCLVIHLIMEWQLAEFTNKINLETFGFLCQILCVLSYGKMCLNLVLCSELFLHESLISWCLRFGRFGSDSLVPGNTHVLVSELGVCGAWPVTLREDTERFLPGAGCGLHNKAQSCLCTKICLLALQVPLRAWVLR